MPLRSPQAPPFLTDKSLNCKTPKPAMHSPPLPNHISRLFYHSLRRISTVRRPQPLIKAQEALTDYLHSTRSLPFTHAEHISTNSPSSLSALLSKIKFSSSNVSQILHRFLRYHPINEFEFFFESIGLSPPEIPAFLPAHQFFLSDASNLVAVVRALVEYGFPWNKLGRIYKEEVSIFGEDLGRLKERLRELEALGFNRVSVVGICLAFPSVLDGNDSLGGGVDALLDDLKRVFFDFDLVGSVGGNLDACYEVCRKIRVFYDLGCEKGKTGELIGTNRDILFEYAEEVLVEKVEFFCRLGARKEDVGLFILRCPEILKFDLEGRVITIFDYLEQLGLDHKELTSIVRQCPHILGKNRLRNLPQSMRALDLHSWFADKIMNGNHHLLPGFETGNYEEELEKDFRNDIERIKHPTKHHHMSGKLDFLLQIGFGNNRHSIEILRHMHGTGIQLQERFDCLLQMGIEYSKLCKMISMYPKILNQNTDMLKQKVNFFFNEMHCSLEQLYAFPSYLCYDLENRIKPRYQFLSRLREKGLHEMHYSPATIITATEKNFIGYLLKIHRAAAKQWFESSLKRPGNGNLETWSYSV